MYFGSSGIADFKLGSSAVSKLYWGSNLVWPPPTETDPYFNNVSLLLHMDGSNGSTTFTDSSSNALAVTPTGDAQISTAQSKFGGSSALFDGSGDYLTTSSTELSFGVGDFTIEGWMYVLTGSSYHAIVSCIPGSDNNSLYVYNSTLVWYDGGNRASSAVFALNAWHHFAVARQDNVIRVFLNGIKSSSDYNPGAKVIDGGSVRIGTRGALGSEFFHGYIDDLRSTKGIARYTSDFTPPTAPFPNS